MTPWPSPWQRDILRRAPGTIDRLRRNSPANMKRTLAKMIDYGWLRLEGDVYELTEEGARIKAKLR